VPEPPPSVALGPTATSAPESTGDAPGSQPVAATGDASSDAVGPAGGADGDVAGTPPDPAPAASASSAPAASGAHVAMGKLSVDGLTARDVSCHVAGGGLLGALIGPAAIIGSIAKRKAELDLCAPAGAEPKVAWTFAGGRTTAVAVSEVTVTVGRCVERVVKSAVTTGDGECAATLVIGRGGP
jgi:hypothetical protein